MKTSKSFFGLFFILLLTFSTACQSMQEAKLCIEGSIEDTFKSADDYFIYSALISLPDKCPSITVEQHAELSRLTPFIKKWAIANAPEGSDLFGIRKNDYLNFFIRPTLLDELSWNRDFPEPSAGSPFYPVWAYYKGRYLIALLIEWGPLLGDPVSRNKYYGMARELLSRASPFISYSPIVRMYLDSHKYSEAMSVGSDQVPQWAFEQRQAILAINSIIQWWMKNRQLSDGQFGGGLNDDVEMWRWWKPVLLGFESKSILEAHFRLSKNVWGSGVVEDGYSNILQDVEHANEFTTDTLLPSILIDGESEKVREHVEKLHSLFTDFWTIKESDGARHFKSIYFSSKQVSSEPKFKFDAAYNIYAIKPLLVYWLNTGDSKYGKSLLEWLYFWKKHILNSAGGRPAGLIPSVIPLAADAGARGLWYRPFAIDSNEALYNWPGVSHEIAGLFLLAAVVTNDKEFLEPVSKYILAFRQLKCSSIDKDCLYIKRKLGEQVSKIYRLYEYISKDYSYKDLFDETCFYFAEDGMCLERHVNEEKLKRFNVFISKYHYFFTHEVRWTDRVIDVERNYFRFFSPERVDVWASIDYLYRSISGDVSNIDFLPMASVRWLVDPGSISARVVGSGGEYFSADLYSFEDRAKSFKARLFRLDRGEYIGKLVKISGGGVGHQSCGQLSPFSVGKSRSTVISFSIEPHASCRLSIARVQR